MGLSHELLRPTSHGFDPHLTIQHLKGAIMQLAVLMDISHGGPAKTVHPTSVCGFHIIFHGLSWPSVRRSTKNASHVLHGHLL